MTQVAHFCTFPHGGAATAAIRHHQSLLEANVDSKFFYHRNQQQPILDPTLVQLEFSPPRYGFLTRAIERRREKQRQRRIYDLFNEHLAIRPEQAETFSMAELPEPTPLNWHQMAAEVVHLHWVSFFADYPSFFRSIPASVPLVWSLHDTNAFTGGCHYPSGCEQFQFGCGDCPQLVHRHRNDVSRASFEAKRKTLSSREIHVVAPCQWMLDLAQRSPVWPKQTSFTKIEYGLDLKHDYPTIKKDAQQAARAELGLDPQVPLVAFGAMEVNNPRKGFQHLVPALHRIANKGDRFECLVFGSGSIESDLPLPKLHEFGFVDSISRKRLIYSAADVVVVPSIEDNQPQIGLEAMACGTPVVAFDATGMPEYVIDGETGLLAETQNEVELAERIETLLFSEKANLRGIDRNQLGANARRLIETRFESEQQRAKWMQLYDSIAFAKNRSYQKVA